MAINTDEGFLGSPDPISVQTDFGLGEHSAFLTEDDVKPSQPYQVTTFQETIAASPAISVGGGYDPYANDLTNIISPFTDPEQIRERREKEKKQRERVKDYGGADPLFQYEPTLDITSPDVPQFAAKVPDPFLQFSPTPRTDLTKKSQTYGLETEVDEDYYAKKYNPRRPGIDEPTFAEVGGDILQKNVEEHLYDTGEEILSQNLQDMYSSYFRGGGSGVNPLGQPMYGSTAPSIYNTAVLGGGSAPASWSGTGYGGINTGGAPSSVGTSSAAKALGYAGAAFGAYSAAEAWGNKDYAGAVTNSAWAVASVNPAALPYAIGLEAISQIGRTFGWWGGKPKPGFGGAEINLNTNTNNLEFTGTTYSYNGFDPSQAGRHANQAVQFLNGWSDKFGMKLNSEKAAQAIKEARIRGGNYLRRIDVSPWKDGSGSSSEMIERWMDSGAYEGNPTYYNAELGERVGFTSQKQYERAVNKYAKSIFG